MNITGFRLLLAISFVFLTAVFVAAGGPGRLDPTFAGSGVKYDGFGGGNDVARKAATGPDGKIVVAGYTSKGSAASDVALARYNPDGTLDTTFNGDGKVVTKVVTGSDQGLAVAIQPDGKIVVAGYAVNGSSADLLVLRYNVNGTLDTTFDGDGKVITALSSADDQALDVAIQPDGKIVAAGTASSDSAVVRYNSNGSLDATFGTGGVVRTSYLSGSGAAFSLAVQADAKIVTAGSSGGDFALVRYNANGSPDAAFDGDGMVTTPVLSGNDAANSVALQADGKIVAAGGAHNGANSDIALVRYNTDGSLDTSFDGDGKMTAAFQDGDDFARFVTIQPDGGIVAAGYTQQSGFPTDFAVIRLNPDGSFDTSFDSDGKVNTPVSPGNAVDGACAVVVLSDGKILAAGDTTAQPNGTAGDFALVRYNPDGSLDGGFSDDGKTTSDIGHGLAWARDVIVQPDGKIVVSALYFATFALIRYNPDGSPDASFGTGGKVFGPFYAIGTPGDLTLQPDGKIILAGSYGLDFNRRIALARYNPDGSFDASFGSGGMVTTAISGSGEYATSVATGPDGKIVIIGYWHNAPQMTYHFAVVRYNPDGSLDTSFDGDGKLTSSTFFGSSVVFQPDGKIVIGGSSSGKFGLTRYNLNGSLDTTFDGDGIVSTPMPGGGSGISSIQLLPDGRIVAGGTAFTGSNNDFAVARYNADGSLDTSFDGDGRVTTPVLAGHDAVNEIAVQSDGRIVAAGSANTGSTTDTALVRYNFDGSLDLSYGTGGKTVIDLGFGDDAYGLALDPTDRAMVVGSANDLYTARITSDFAPLVDVGGRVTSLANGQGIGNAQVVLRDESNNKRYALTNAFGYYGFSGVSSNEVYVVSVSSKRYRFQPPSQTITVINSIGNVDFVGNQGSESKSAVVGGEKAPIGIQETTHEKQSGKRY